MNFAATTSCPTKSPVRSSVERSIHPSSLIFQPSFAPRSPQTPSLPDARPRSDRFRCGGRESKFLAAIEPLEARIAPAVLFAVEAGQNKLVSFDSAAPGTLLTDVAITGLAAGEIVSGIDVDPVTGQLLALGIVDEGANRRATVYVLDPATGTATASGFADMVLGDTAVFGFDVNPVDGSAHLVNDLDGNHDLSRGGGFGTYTNLDDPAANETITSIAYDRPFGSLKTTLYGYNFFTDELVTIGDKDGSPSEVTDGAVKPIARAKLNGANFSSAMTEAMGFDIGGPFGGPELGWIALNNFTTKMRLYNIDLATAALTDLGTIGDGTRLFSGLTVQTEAAAPAISTDGKTATWSDLDGDAVTLKITKGTLTPANFRMLAGATGSALSKLTLTDAQFSGTNITITAKPGANGGDGRVNVGEIDALGVDLGIVSVAGDLVSIDAGTVNSPAPSVKALTVGSIAAYGFGPVSGGIDGQRSFFADGAGSITVKGDFSGFLYLGSSKTGSITIGGDVVGLDITSSGSMDHDSGASVGKLTVKGSIRGSSADLSGRIILTQVGSVFIGGDIIGDGFASGTVSINGTGKTAIKVGGSIIGGDNADFSGALTAKDAAQVSVGGSVIGGGASSSGSLVLTNGGSLKIGGSLVGGSGSSSGKLSLSAGTTSIAIKGSIVGGSGALSGSILDSGSGAVLKGLAIGGSIVSNGGLLHIAVRQIGALKVGGDIAGYDGGTVRITAMGKATPATLAESIAIGSLTVGGDVFNTTIAAGITGDLLAFTPDAAIGAVKIKGDMVASSISAGIDPQNDIFGDGDDTLVGGNTGNAAIIARIASITIGGQLLGTVGGAPDIFAIQAEEIGALTVGKIKAPLTAAKDDLTLGFTGDIRVREL